MILARTHARLRGRRVNSAALTKEVSLTLSFPLTPSLSLGFAPFLSRRVDERRQQPGDDAFQSRCLWVNLDEVP
jgi:hypothetical protein